MRGGARGPSVPISELRGVPGVPGVPCVGCLVAQHPCVGFLGSLVSPAWSVQGPWCPLRGVPGRSASLRGVPGVPRCPLHGVPRVPVSPAWDARHPSTPPCRSERHNIHHPSARTLGCHKVRGDPPSPIPAPVFPQPPTGLGSLSPSCSWAGTKNRRAPQGRRVDGCAGVGTGSECAVLMSVARLRELRAFPFLLFYFFSSRCRDRLVLEPRFQPHRAPSALFCKFSSQGSLKCGWPSREEPGARGARFLFLSACRERGIMDSSAPRFRGCHSNLPEVGETCSLAPLSQGTGNKSLFGCFGKALDNVTRACPST